MVDKARIPRKALDCSLWYGVPHVVTLLLVEDDEMVDPKFATETSAENMSWWSRSDFPTHQSTMMDKLGNARLD